MTWGAMVDTRRALTTFFVVILVVILSIFICVLSLAGGNILTVNSSSPFYPTPATLVP